MNLKINQKKKQNRLYVTFRENEQEIKLYNWIVEHSQVGGVSNYFKQLALKDMQSQEKEGQ
ncbi:hypothetical protein FC778_15335 [Clostridium botulinum]|nr:hypothetical protein [Clostridium botulinum]